MKIKEKGALVPGEPFHYVFLQEVTDKQNWARGVRTPEVPLPCCPWPAGKFHTEELVVGSGFTQMPKLLPCISDPHWPTLIRINDEEHGLQVCRQETGPGPVSCSLTQDGCWPYLHGRLRTTQASGTAFASGLLPSGVASFFFSF